MKYVTWIEPFDTLNSGENLGPLYCFLAVEEAIKHRHHVVSATEFRYSNDEEALNDFVISHWGKIVEFNPDEG